MVHVDKLFSYISIHLLKRHSANAALIAIFVETLLPSFRITLISINSNLFLTSLRKVCCTRFIRIHVIYDVDSSSTTFNCLV